MPADFSKPVKTDNYDTGFLATVRAHTVALAQMLEPSDAGALSNVPTGARRFNAATGVLERFNGSSWVEQSVAYVKTAALNATYAPLNGVGTSGTWSISISGSAAAAPWTGITGKPAIVSEVANTAATANSVAKRTAEGYLNAIYYNQSSTVESTTIGAVIVENIGADGYFRKASLANFSSVITPAWVNVAGRPSNVTAFSNDAGYLTGAALSGLAALSTGPTFAGTVKANGGGKGLGAITVTTTAGAPTGGQDGDLVLVY